MASGTISQNGPRGLYWRAANGGSGQRKLVIDVSDAGIQIMLIMFVHRRSNRAPSVVAVQIYSGSCGLIPLSSNATDYSASISGNSVSVSVTEDYLTAYVLSSTAADLYFTTA